MRVAAAGLAALHTGAQLGRLQKKARTVWWKMSLTVWLFQVGNIPYGSTEEQLAEVFKEVGPVVSFRLVFDRDTGKPRGYGFCEYRDSETALSAMRNLNGYE